MVSVTDLQPAEIKGKDVNSETKPFMLAMLFSGVGSWRPHSKLQGSQRITQIQKYY